MALRALQCRVRPDQRETGGSVIEGRVGPQRRIVAALAGCRILERNMVDWSLGRVVVRLVARYTRRVRELVIIVDVTLGTSGSRVFAGQSPAGLSVVKSRAGPVRRAVAAFACRRQAERDVVHRRLRVVVIRLVAGYAGRIRQFVVIVDMTLGAFGVRFMEPGQRPARGGVVEARSSPNCLVVAPFAGGRLADLHMVGAGRVLIFLRVAVVTAPGWQLIVVADVASDAVEL